MATVPGSLLGAPKLQLLDTNGDPVAGGKLYTYVVGTTTPQLTYQDSLLTIPNTNPVILDSSGRATVFLQAKSYKMVLDNALDVQQWTQDEIQDVGQILLATQEFNVINSPWINLDNGAGATIDGVLLRLSKAVTLSAARVIYVDATSGTVSAGSIQLGTTVGGSDIVAVKNYENSKAVGGQTNLTLASTALNAGQPLHYRHIGVAATQPGQVIVQIEFA